MAQSYSQQLNQYSDMQGATQQAGLGYTDAVPKTPSELETGANRVESLANQAGIIVKRLDALSDRIFGGAATGNQEAKGNPRAVPNGILQVMGESLDNLAARLNRLDELTSRLERLA
jgi:hypothetical protein